MRSRIFSNKLYVAVQQSVTDRINSERDIVSVRSLNSPRAVGDGIQDFIGSIFPSLFPPDILKNYNSEFARRSMADFAFEDVDDFYYIVDNKTHNTETKFNMPNLTSVERLARFYGDDRNYFTLLLVSYNINEGQICVGETLFLPIEHLSWSCLTIGALGWGQIQIANSNRVIVDRAQTRKSWMIELCDRLSEFYPNEIGKIEERIDYFRKIRAKWVGHENN